MRRLSLQVSISVTVAVIIVLFPISPSLAQPLPPCTMDIDPIWNEGEKLIELLQYDPFGIAFKVYIRDLKDNQTKLDDWRKHVEHFLDNQCHPVEQEYQHHEAILREHDQRCAGKPPDVWTKNQCQQSFDWLLASKARLDPKLAANKAKEQEFNQAGATLLTAEKQAVQQARSVLDPKNTEDAFRLFALTVAKDVNAGRLTSCEALAQMSDALGPKAAWQYGRHLAVMGSVLASEDNPIVIDPHARSVRFTASGFRRRFVGPPGRGLENANQVRHATAYLMAGAEFGAAGATFASYIQDRIRHLIRGRVPEEHDYLLGIAAGEIGRTLQLHTLSVKDLGHTLRARLCGD